MEEHTLDQALALREWNLCTPFRKLMNERRSICTFWHYGGEIIASSVPRHLFDWFEVIEDETEASFKLSTLSQVPLYCRLDTFAFCKYSKTINIVQKLNVFVIELTDSINLRSFGQNVVGLFDQHLIAHFRVNQQQSVARCHGYKRNLCVRAPRNRPHNVSSFDGLNATPGLNFPN